MTTIIATETFNDTAPSTRTEQHLTQEVLEDILKELKKLNIQMSIMTDEEIQNQEIE
jgi:hypothetical protein